MSLLELETEKNKLPIGERAALVKWLLDSFDDLSEAEIDRLWTEEAERRLDEMERGEVAGIPADEVFRRVRASIS